MQNLPLFYWPCLLTSHAFILKVMLQLAESGSFFGQVDLFKVRGKFALSDAYEDHFLLCKGKILIITHRRVILLQVSSTDSRLFMALQSYIKRTQIKYLTVILPVTATLQHYGS